MTIDLVKIMHNYCPRVATVIVQSPTEQLLYGFDAGVNDRKHAMLSGHGLTENTVLRYAADDQPAGVVKAVCVGRSGAGSFDVALAELDQPDSCSNYVTTSTGQFRCICNKCTQAPFEQMRVEKFRDGCDTLTGHVVHDNFNCLQPIRFGCFTMQTLTNEQPIHVDGESGMLVTTPPVDHIVQVKEYDQEATRAEIVCGVGMLVGISEAKTKDGRQIEVSVGIPIDKNLDALMNHPNCAGNVGLCSN